MTQVKEMTNPELNRKLADLMGYSIWSTITTIPRYRLVKDGRFASKSAATEDETFSLYAPNYCTDPAASLEIEAVALAKDNAGYVRNLAIVKWGDAVDPEEVADWTNIDIQGVGDLLSARPRERAEAAYITLQGAT